MTWGTGFRRSGRAACKRPPSSTASYLRGFFDWAKARGYYPPFAKDDNPAAEQIVFGTREKRARRARRAFGFKAFTDDQVRALFGQKALSGLSEAARWGAWIGLYTGARVAEVGQLALANFVEVDGIPCLHITDEGEGQSVKNDASIRTIRHFSEASVVKNDSDVAQVPDGDISLPAY